MHFRQEAEQSVRLSPKYQVRAQCYKSQISSDGGTNYIELNLSEPEHNNYYERETFNHGIH